MFKSLRCYRKQYLHDNFQKVNNKYANIYERSDSHFVNEIFRISRVKFKCEQVTCSLFIYCQVHWVSITSS